MASKVIDDLNVTGTITASGYNDSNWNTAHGWGNHSGLYDDYSSFNLKTNGVQRTTITSGATLDIVASSNMTVAYGAGGVVTLSSANDNTTYSAGSGLDLTGTSFSVESDLREVSHIGKDNSNYIQFNVGAAGHTDFYVGGTWSARLQANGELHVIGDIVAFSDIFIP